MIYNILLNAKSLPKEVEIVIVVGIVLLSAAFGFFVIKSILKEQKDWKNRESKTGLIAYKDFEAYVKSQLKVSKKKSQFAVFHLDILDSEAISKSLGETQYNNAILKLVENIRLVFDSVIRVAKFSNEILYIGMRIKENKKQVSIENIAKQVLYEAKKTIALAGILKVDFDVNLGIAIFPEAGQTWEELKQNLDITVVSSKRKGVNEYSIYSLEISNKESEEYKNYLEIKEAIENKEFMVYYQPIIDLETKEVWAAETLLRWKHKDRGVLPPSSFLNIMEHTGDINWVGFWP